MRSYPLTSTHAPEGRTVTAEILERLLKRGTSSAVRMRYVSGSYFVEWTDWTGSRRVASSPDMLVALSDLLDSTANH